MKEFIKNKYNIIIPVFLVIVLGISLVLYATEYKNNRYAKSSDVSVYQYFSGVKMEYTASVSRNKKNVILEYDNKEFPVSLDSTPVYFKDSENVIFPKEMSIVFPLTSREYQVNALAEIYKKNNLYYLNIRDLNKPFSNVFYFDGNNLYYFTDEVTLTVGDKNIKLSPMSYVSCSYHSLLEYYDKANDKYEVIELDDEDVFAYNDYMRVDVGSDKIIYKDSFALLTKDFSVLSKITEMEK